MEGNGTSSMQISCECAVLFSLRLAGVYGAFGARLMRTVQWYKFLLLANSDTQDRLVE